MPKKDYMKEMQDDSMRSEKMKSYKAKGMSERDALMKSMVSMKREKKEMEEATPVPVSPSSKDDYPYGLRISLEDDSLEKLGLKEMPEVGKSMKMEAMCKVCGTSSNQSEGDEGPRKRLEIQLTDMKLSPSGKKESKDA